MVGAEQRWRWRRATAAQALFDPRGWRVEKIAFAPARDFVVAHHYAASMPACRLTVGLVTPAGELAGVIAFSVPMSQAVIPRLTGLPPEQGVDMGRVVLLDEVGRNAESWFLARAFACVTAELPKVRAVVSFSDPVIWEGGPWAPVGHVGTIYQAHSGRCVGRSRAAWQPLGDQSGRVINRRLRTKFAAGPAEKGYAYAAARLAGEFGEKRGGETDREYLDRVMGEAWWVRHTGNHAYAWPIGRGGARGARVEARHIAADFPAALPYPKTPDVLQRVKRAPNGQTRPAHELRGSYARAMREPDTSFTGAKRELYGS